MGSGKMVARWMMMLKLCLMFCFTVTQSYTEKLDNVGIKIRGEDLINPPSVVPPSEYSRIFGRGKIQEENIISTVDGGRKWDEFKSQYDMPLLTKDVLEHFEKYLAPWEQKEVQFYNKVWYLGMGFPKPAINRDGDDNFGFSEESFNGFLHFKVIIGGHIAYRYMITNLIGKGTFGTVIEAFDLKYNRWVAIKIFALDENRSSSHRINEVSMLLFAKSVVDDVIPNIYDTFVFRNHFCIVEELMGTSLSEVEFPLEDDKEIQTFAKVIAGTMAKLNKENILHNDLKPSNLVFGSGHKTLENLKLVDFGHSCVYGSEEFLCPQYAQSDGYASPEMLFGLPYDSKSDMFSFGLILIEMALGKNHFGGDNRADSVAAMMEVLGVIPQDILQEADSDKLFNDALNSVTSRGIKRMPLRKPLSWLLEIVPENLSNLITRCLSYNPSNRPTFKEVLRHPFIIDSTST